MNTPNTNMNKSKSLITFKEFKNRMEDVHNFGNEWGLFIDIENHTHSFVKAKAEEAKAEEAKAEEAKAEAEEAKAKAEEAKAKAEEKAKAKEAKAKEKAKAEAKENLQKKNIQKYIDEYKHIFEPKPENEYKEDEDEENDKKYDKNDDPNNNNFFNYTFRILIFINLTYAILYLT